MHLLQTQNNSYPGTTEAAEPMRVGLVPVVQLDVIVAAIGLLLHLKGNEAQLDAVALLGGQQPLAVGVTGVVVVSKLGVRVEVLLANFCLQTTSTFCDEGGKTEAFQRFYPSSQNRSRAITTSRH